MEENGRYEYVLLSDTYSLNEKSGIIKPSLLADRKAYGVIEPGNYVGLLKLELTNSEGNLASETHIDVRSTKLNYGDEYRSMLEDIADRCADFLLQLDSPVDQTFVADDTIHEATLAQRLYFLKSLLGSEDFQMALQRIVHMPNTRWREEALSVDMRQSRRIGRNEVRQLASGGRRIKIPNGHPLQAAMKTIPDSIEVYDKRDTVDTMENRFVKYALNTFLQTLEDLLERLPTTGNTTYPGLRSEIDGLVNYLEETTTHNVFKEVCLPVFLPLNSPVLQRKEGYRQVLRAWTLFELAAKLSWTGGDDVYKGGKRNAPALYEYWVFFKLLDLVANLFKLDNPPIDDLIDYRDLVLKLKAGKQLPITGVYDGAGRKLRVEFSYNRTFGVNGDYPAQGSWTCHMRPDYTLSLWPADFSQDEAEKQELISHVHFDAKYKVESLRKLFGRQDQNLDEEKAEQRAGKYKRADLLKMHAYRDAIRRSAGAYVIYPGDEKEHEPFRGFNELLPGLGAFPLRPNSSDDGSVALACFLKEVVAHVCNRASQHEQQTYYTYQIHKNDPPAALREALPEADPQFSERQPVPADSSVLVAYFKGQRHLDWILDKKKYNCRADLGKGSLPLKHDIVGASYLLLHTKKDVQTFRLFRIASKGPKVYSKETLQDQENGLGYHTRPSSPYYLVYEISEIEKENPLNQYQWTLTKIPGWSNASARGIPFAVNLSDFMSVAEHVGCPLDK